MGTIMLTSQHKREKFIFHKSESLTNSDDKNETEEERLARINPFKNILNGTSSDQFTNSQQKNPFLFGDAYGVRNEGVIGQISVISTTPKLFVPSGSSYFLGNFVRRSTDQMKDPVIEIVDKAAPALILTPIAHANHKYFPVDGKSKRMRALAMGVDLYLPFDLDVLKAAYSILNRPFDLNSICRNCMKNKGIITRLYTVSLPYDDLMTSGGGGLFNFEFQGKLLSGTEQSILANEWLKLPTKLCELSSLVITKENPLFEDFLPVEYQVVFKAIHAYSRQIKLLKGFIKSKSDQVKIEQIRKAAANAMELFGYFGRLTTMCKKCWQIGLLDVNQGHLNYAKNSSNYELWSRTGVPSWLFRQSNFRKQLVTTARRMYNVDGTHTSITPPKNQQFQAKIKNQTIKFEVLDALEPEEGKVGSSDLKTLAVVNELRRANVPKEGDVSSKTKSVFDNIMSDFDAVAEDEKANTVQERKEYQDMLNDSIEHEQTKRSVSIIENLQKRRNNELDRILGAPLSNETSEERSSSRE